MQHASERSRKMTIFRERSLDYPFKDSHLDKASVGSG